MNFNSLKIIYEDNHLLVVEKAVNILSQADSSGDPDLLSLLKADLKERYQKPGNVYLGLVHRLDRPVGGVMIFAKTSKAASRLSAQIRTREFQKKYLAVLHGKPAAANGELRHYLLKDSKSNQVTVYSRPVPGAKEGLLEYKVVESNHDLTLIRVDLHTGRSHQIRAQFAFIGHPLFGDQKYGAGLAKPGEQIALWSEEIRCLHPTKNELMVFDLQPPKMTPWDQFSLFSE